MQSNALVAGQDASGSHADMTASAMEMVGGQHGCAGHMQPLQATLDTQPTLIEMDDRVSEELCADAFPSRLGAADKLTAGREYDRLRGCIAVERSQQLFDTRQGDELLAVQVAGERFQTRAILGRLGHVGRKRLHAGATARTLLDRRLMLYDFDANRRHVEHLPFHMPLGHDRRQLCLAVWTVL